MPANPLPNHHWQVLLPVGEAPEEVFQRYASLVVRHRQVRRPGAGRGRRPRPTACQLRPPTAAQLLPLPAGPAPPPLHPPRWS